MIVNLPDCSSDRLPQVQTSHESGVMGSGDRIWPPVTGWAAAKQPCKGKLLREQKEE